MPLLLKLFLTFFKIGLFSFGGGYGMLPLMEQEALANNWLTDAEFLNFVAIAESTPGPVAINMSTFIGTTQGGFWGGIIATLGTITPSVIVILLIVAVFKSFLESGLVKSVLSGIKPTVAGLILATGVFMALKNFLPNVTEYSLAGINYRALALMIALGAVAIIYKQIKKKNISPILLIVCAAISGIIIF